VRAGHTTRRCSSADRASLRPHGCCGAAAPADLAPKCQRSGAADYFGNMAREQAAWIRGPWAGFLRRAEALGLPVLATVGNGDVSANYGEHLRLQAAGLCQMIDCRRVPLRWRGGAALCGLDAVGYPFVPLSFSGLKDMERPERPVGEAEAAEREAGWRGGGGGDPGAGLVPFEQCPDGSLRAGRARGARSTTAAAAGTGTTAHPPSRSASDFAAEPAGSEWVRVTLGPEASRTGDTIAEDLALPVFVHETKLSAEGTSCPGPGAGATLPELPRSGEMLLPGPDDAAELGLRLETARSGISWSAQDVTTSLECRVDAATLHPSISVGAAAEPVWEPEPGSAALGRTVFVCHTPPWGTALDLVSLARPWPCLLRARCLRADGGTHYEGRSTSPSLRGVLSECPRPTGGPASRPQLCLLCSSFPQTGRHASVGSTAVREFLERRRPLLSLHGHIHSACAVSGRGSQAVGRGGPTTAVASGNDPLYTQDGLPDTLGVPGGSEDAAVHPRASKHRSVPTAYPRGTSVSLAVVDVATGGASAPRVVRCSRHIIKAARGSVTMEWAERAGARRARG